MQADASAARNCTVVELGDAGGCRRRPRRAWCGPSPCRETPRARLPPCRAPAPRWRSAARPGTIACKADWLRAHAGRGGVTQARRRSRARCAGTNALSATMVLLPVPASPIVCQLSSMAMSAVRSRKKPGLRRTAGLRNHAAEELPLRIVAAAAEAARSGNQIAAVDRDRLRRPAHRCRPQAPRGSRQIRPAPACAKQAISH